MRVTSSKTLRNSRALNSDARVFVRMPERQNQNLVEPTESCHSPTSAVVPGRGRIEFANFINTCIHTLGACVANGPASSHRKPGELLYIKHKLPDATRAARRQWTFIPLFSAPPSPSPPLGPRPARRDWRFSLQLMQPNRLNHPILQVTGARRRALIYFDKFNDWTRYARPPHENP